MNLLGKGTTSARIVIRKSFRTFGKIITKGCGNGCAANSPSPCGTRGNDNFISAAIASGSRHFSGAGKATGCFLLPKSKACSLQEWFRRDPIAGDWITCLHSPRCRGRELVLKEFNSCPRDTGCALRREVRARVRSLPNAPTGKWIFRRRVKRNGERIHVRWWMNSSGSFCRLSKNGCARMCR